MSPPDGCRTCAALRDVRPLTTPSRGVAQPSDGAEPQLGLAGLQMTTAVARGRVVFRLFGGARGDPWPTH
eukprot:6118076-Alexandrium_andersonii.AAC.1